MDHDTDVMSPTCNDGEVVKSTLNVLQLNSWSEVTCSKQRLWDLLWCQTIGQLWTFTKNAEAPRKHLTVLCNH